MESYLYQDLYLLEEEHWWHKAKRQLVTEALSWCQAHQQKTFSPKTDTLLDVGCGTGKNLEAFSRLLKTFGTDMSKEALRFCKKRGLKNLALGDGETLPYKKNTFTIVTALDVVEHTDDRQILAEIYRVLKPGGYLIVTVPAFQFLWSKWDEVLHHQRRYTTRSLEAVISQTEFVPLKTSYLYSFLLLPILVIRTIKQLISSTKYGSDFTLSHPVINTVMQQVSKLERKIFWRFGLPFGSSVVIIAQKPASLVVKPTLPKKR